MSEIIVERLKAMVVPRIPLDIDKIESRFIIQNQNKSKKKKRELSGEERMYLKDVYKDRDIPLTARAESLGLSSHISTKIKNELVKRGLVEEYEIKINGIKKNL